MKATKIMITIMVVFFYVNIFAQTSAEINLSLTNNHQSILKHTNAIASGEAKTVNEQISHYNEARKSLAGAKKAHSQLKIALPAKYRSAAIVHHDNIDKYHATATSHANAMVAEFKNNNPDYAKLEELGRKFYVAINMAEKEHQELIKATK
jgi:hypothetical protein